jgi:hypothetical protein
MVDAMTDDEIRELAREEWVLGNDDIQMDDDAEVARVDAGGAWVQAWVWVSEPAEGEA